MLYRNNTVRTIFLLVCITIFFKMSLFALASFGSNLLPVETTFMHHPVFLGGWRLPSWLHGFANFDGVHYTTIAQKGYLGTANIQAFFPLFPIILYLLTLLVHNQVIAGLLASSIFLIILVPLWYFFIAKQFDKNAALHAVLALLTFPTAFFFNSLYTESLFLLLIILSFWSVQKKYFYVTALCVAGATATKVVGTALIPALLLQLLWQNQAFQKAWHSLFSREMLSFSRENIYKKTVTFFNTMLQTIQTEYWGVAAILIGSIGLISYMLYLLNVFGDPLYFFSVQKDFGGIRETELVSYPRVLIRSLRVLMDTPLDSLRFFPYLQELLAGGLGMLATLWAFTRKDIPPAYPLFGILSMLIPAATGTFSSLPRYIMVNFVLYLLLAQVLKGNRILQFAWYTTSCILLCINTILFTQGYWVA